MYDQIYKVTFEDGEDFIGGNLQFPGWNKCVSEGIKSLEITLPYGEKLILSGYEKYNLFIGAVKSLSDGRTTISHMFGLGCIGPEVTSYRITLVSSEQNKYRLGDITVRKFPFGKEGIGRTSTTGWKLGISK